MQELKIKFWLKKLHKINLWLRTHNQTMILYKVNLMKELLDKN
jgi:hypothetical protein